MNKTPTAPKTLQEAIRYFADPDTCLAFMVEIRWPNGVTCPTCESREVRFLATRRLWECKAKHPKRQFSAKVGTIFEDSPIGLDKWFAATWLIANAKNGISSYEIGRALGVTQKTGWFMMHRIRLAMRTGTFRKLSGQVEADETFIGGESKYMHFGKREEKRVGKGADVRYLNKTVVAGLLRRGGRVRAKVVSDTKAGSLIPFVHRHVAPKSELITDKLMSYRYPGDYLHSIIDKTKGYVRGHIHTNGLENFWSLLKRTIKGTYISVDPVHLNRYVDEQVYRYNQRKHTQGDGGRFVNVLRSVMGRRLTYAALTT
jgi:transposase-like protein